MAHFEAQFIFVQLFIERNHLCNIVYTVFSTFTVKTYKQIFKKTVH